MKIERRLIFLDCLRIFAFVSVLVGHKFYDVVGGLSKNDNAPIALGIIDGFSKAVFFGGGAGVIVFFMVSGYVITLTLQNENSHSFLLKRIFRIYPLYITAITLEAVLDYHFNHVAYPSLSILLPRILLVGDFFNTPYALNNVEWTLRIELLFYIFMAFLKFARLIRFPGLLPLIYVLAILFLQFAGPFPAASIWSHGYITLFAPFLFMGSCAYLMERKGGNKTLALCCMAYILISYFYVSAAYGHARADSYFVLFALVLFFGTWLIRGSLKGYFLLIIFSDLTYSVYLFHNWLWKYLELAVQNFSFILGYQRLQILFLLLVVCYFFCLTIEKLGVFLGRKILGQKFF